MNAKYKYLIILLLIVFCFIAFGRILGNGFVNFDDEGYITKNLHVQVGINFQTVKWAFTSVVASNWHPLTILSHALDWQLFGANAFGHHLINLLLHIGSVLLLFIFLNKSTKAMWPSALVAALFALHPLRVESVAWASERKDVLSMFLGLSSIYAYICYVEISRLSRYFISLFLFALSLLAKPMLVTLPFVLLLLDYWPLARWQKVSALANAAAPVNILASGKKKSKHSKTGFSADKKITAIVSATKYSNHLMGRLFWEKIPFLFLAIASSIVTIWAQDKGGSIASLQKVQLTERISNALISYIAYLGKIFWPVNLAVFYPYEYYAPIWQVLGASLLLLAISTVVICLFRKAPFLAVGWLLYLGVLFPVIGLMQVGDQAMADRYTYFPSVGISVMVVWGIFYLWPEEKLRKIILIPGMVILAALTFLTWQQCGYWKNSNTLFNHAWQATKDNYLAHNNLGKALEAEGKKEKAITHYLAAIETNPNFSIGHYNLGVIMSAQGKHEEAITHYLAAIKTNPNFDDAYYNLANLYIKQRKTEEAIDNYRRAIQISPDHFDARNNLADVFVKQNKFDQAIEHFREAVRITPSSFGALNNLGVNLEKQLKHEEAIYYYRKALLIDPKDPGIYFNLGVALGNKGDLKEAAENFRQSVNLKPDYEEARRALKLAQELEKR